MMVLYRSPEYQVVKVVNEETCQIETQSHLIMTNCEPNQFGRGSQKDATRPYRL